MDKIRALVALALALIGALVIAGCGGGGGNDEDPQQVLNETFSNDQKIQSGTLDLGFKIDASGGDNDGTFEAKVGGPFQGEQGKVPQFDVDASLKAESGSQSFSGSGGLTSTGSSAFVNFQGTEYQVPQELFDRFTSTFTQLQDRSSSEQGSGLLESLGIDPTNWLTDLNNAGTEDVQGTDTIHITGQADVPKLVADLKTIAQKAGSAAPNIDLSQMDQLDDTIKSADFDVFTGEDDKLLRRLEASVELEPQADTPDAPDSLSVDFELTLGDVNKPQTVQAPEGAQPLTGLLQQLGLDPGRLGESLRGGLGTGGALPQTGGSTAAPSNDATQAYLNCLSQAKGQAALQQCADLLGQ